MKRGSVEAVVRDQWPVFAAWDALFKGRVLTREVFYTEDHATFNVDRGSEAGQGSLHTGEGKADEEIKKRKGGASLTRGAMPFYPGEEIAVAALSMNPMASNWWAPSVCRAARRSPVLADMRVQVGPRLDTLALHSFREVGVRVIRRAVSKHWPNDTHGGRGGSNGSEELSTLSLSREKKAWAWLESGKLILMVDRAASRGRNVHNAAQLWKGLVNAFGDTRPLLRVVTDSTMSYLAQYALWRSAALVIGVHGGNLGGCLWLSPGQSLIELGFSKCLDKPTQFAHVSTALGARYRCVELNPGADKDKGGSVDVEKAVARAIEVLRS